MMIQTETGPGTQQRGSKISGDPTVGVSLQGTGGGQATCSPPIEVGDQASRGGTATGRPEGDAPERTLSALGALSVSENPSADPVESAGGVRPRRLSGAQCRKCTIINKVQAKASAGDNPPVSANSGDGCQAAAGGAAGGEDSVVQKRDNAKLS
jgi:hypothetical protein